LQFLIYMMVINLSANRGLFGEGCNFFIIREIVLLAR
jgi:hypothetical protein